MKTKHKNLEMVEISKYFDDPNNFTEEQWEKIQHRKLISGLEISTETVKNQKEAPKKIKKHNALKSARRNWLPIR